MPQMENNVMRLQSTLLIVAIALVSYTASHGDCPGYGECECEYEIWCCQDDISTQVPCGPVNCPWDWVSWSSNVLTCQNCPTGIIPNSGVLWVVPHSGTCHYRKGVCIDFEEGLCMYSDWIDNTCPGPFDLKLRNGVGCVSS